MRPISAVVLQARKNTDQYVTKYKVLTSADADGPFTYVADGAEFIGNTRPNSDEKATARFLRQSLRASCALRLSPGTRT